MKRIEDHLPDLVVGAPVSADVFVQTGYATFDTSALMNKLAEYWMPEIALALDRANVRAWVSADLLAELKAKAKDRHLGNEKRSCAKKAYMFIERMLRNDQLKVFSEMTEMPTGEDDDIRESSGRPPFLDNVIAARIRLYSQEVPSAVLSCDKNLARTLLMPQYQPYECSERSFLVQVFTLTPDGICPWTIEEPEPAEEDALESKVEAAQRRVLPLSLLSAKTATRDALFPRQPLGKTIMVNENGTEIEYKLGKLIRRDVGSKLYTIAGHKEKCLRAYDSPSISMAIKSEMLVEKAALLDNLKKDAELPLAVAGRADGSFAGIIVPRMDDDNVLLSELLDSEGRARHNCEWDRLDMCRAALAAAKLTAKLQAAGVRLVNLSPNVFVVKRGDEGSFDPSQIVVQDLVNAQLGDAERGQFPGIHNPEYVASELSEADVPVYGSEQTLAFSVLVMSVQLLLGGVHPFAQEGRSISESMKVGEFLAADRDPAIFRMFSRTSGGFKALCSDAFKTHRAVKLEGIVGELDHLVRWIEKSDDPQDRSFTPATYKEETVCKDCGQTFVARGESRKHNVCGACWSKSVGICFFCKEPMEMTRGEMLRRGISDPPHTCKACGSRKKPAKVPAPVKRPVLYEICGQCGLAYSTATGCSCTAKVADNGASVKEESGVVRRRRSVAAAMPEVEKTETPEVEEAEASEVEKAAVPEIEEAEAPEIERAETSMPKVEKVTIELPKEAMPLVQAPVRKYRRPVFANISIS